MDGVNFAPRTLWEGQIEEGNTYRYLGSRRGCQFLAEATDLSRIPSESYDFLLSSNCLEHVANPIRALVEWKRVVRRDGALIVVVPHKVHNFDHRRPDTTLEHLLADHAADVGEDDLTHVEEILRLHDLSRDPGAGSVDAFRARTFDNMRHRALHHHVFDHGLLRDALGHVGLEVVDVTVTPKDIFSLALRR